MIRIKWVVDRGLHRGAELGVLSGAVGLAAIMGLGISLYLWLSNGSEYDLMITFGINAVLVVGLQIFVGNTGIMSFGHMSFVSLGAYAAGIMAVPVLQKSVLLPDLPSVLRDNSFPVVVTLLFAGLIASVFALMVGPVIMRLTGIAAGITTLALLVITSTVLRNTEKFTRGNQTFFGVPSKANLPLVFGTLVGAVAIAALVKWSPVGMRARAVRDDPLAAETSGIRILSARLWPFVASAFVSGVAGALLAYQLTAFSVNSFFLVQTIPIVVILILGGSTSLTGALVGTAVFTGWQEFVRSIENGHLGPLEFASVNGIADLSIGLGLLLILLLRPMGIMGALEPQLVARRRNPQPGGASPPAPSSTDDPVVSPSSPSRREPCAP